MVWPGSCVNGKTGATPRASCASPRRPSCACRCRQRGSVPGQVASPLQCQSPTRVVSAHCRGWESARSSVGRAPEGGGPSRDGRRECLPPRGADWTDRAKSAQLETAVVTDTMALGTVGAELASSHAATAGSQDSRTLQIAKQRGLHEIRGLSRRHNCGRRPLGWQCYQTRPVRCMPCWAPGFAQPPASDCQSRVKAGIAFPTESANRRA